MQVILMNSQRKLLPESFALCSKISQVDKRHALLGFGASGSSHGNRDRSSSATKSGMQSRGEKSVGEKERWRRSYRGDWR